MGIRHSLVTLAGLMATACTVGPNYSAPEIVTPPAFRNAPPLAANDDGQWWSRFDDPVLAGLIARAAGANLDLQQAIARVRQARAQLRIARARALPSVDASAEASHTRLSKHGTIAEIARNLPAGGPIGLPGSEITSYQTGLDASWELDLFGGTRRGVEAARARTAAAEWNARDAQLSLFAEVANGYFRYRLAEARLVLIEQRAAEQHESLQTVTARVRNGLVSTIDQRRGEQRLAATAAARETLGADREEALQMLAALLAEPASAIEPRLAARGTSAAMPHVPAGLPAELLRRRPDVRAAERRLAAATADIGVAIADLYPKLTLTGGVDLVSTSLASLFTAGSLQPTAAARLVFPLFDGGRRRGTVDLRKAERDEAYAAYQAAVLDALRDVEVALSRLAADRARLAELAAAAASSRDAYDTARVQYRAGLTGGLELFTAQDDWLSARDGEAQAEGQVRLDIVALNKALGGGWSDNLRSDK